MDTTQAAARMHARAEDFPTNLDAAIGEIADLRQRLRSTQGYLADTISENQWLKAAYQRLKDTLRFQQAAVEEAEPVGGWPEDDLSEPVLTSEPEESQPEESSCPR